MYTPGFPLSNFSSPCFFLAYKSFTLLGANMTTPYFPQNSFHYLFSSARLVSPLHSFFFFFFFLISYSFPLVRRPAHRQRQIPWPLFFFHTSFSHFHSFLALMSFPSFCVLLGFAFASDGSVV